MTTALRLKKLERACRLILEALDEDPARPGLTDTPRRFARWWNDIAEYADPRAETTFHELSCDEMVVVRSIPVWSICEHHLLPFSGTVTIGYVPQGKVLGLSKFARIARLRATRLQVQERLTSEIADAIGTAAGTPNVAVYMEGVHLCMQMRGVKSGGAMITSDLRGVFRNDPKARSEFLAMARQHHS